MADLSPLECAAARDLMPDAVAGTLSPSQYAALQTHVRGCATCVAEFDQWRQIAAMARAEPIAPPIMSLDDAWAGIVARLAESAPTTPSPFVREDTRMQPRRDLPPAPTQRPTTIPTRPRALPAIAAALIITLLGAGLFTLLAHRTGVGTTATATKTATTAGNCPAGAVHASIPTGAFLADLTMVSPEEGWAVGGMPTAQSTPTNLIDHPLIMHYVSCQWSAVTLPSLPLTDLYSVSFGTADDGWAVGSYMNPTTDAVTSLVLHFTGGRWQVASLPNIPQAQGQTEQVAMYSATDGWMLVDHGKGGFGLSQVSLLHYADGAWSAVTTPYESPSVLAPIGPDAVWVAGETGYEKAFLARYQGGAWSDAHIPENMVVSALHMTSATNGWAAALQSTPSNVYVDSVTPIALRYDGVSWRPVNIAPQAQGRGEGIQMFSDDEGWILDYENIVGLSCCTVSSQFYSGGTWTMVAWPFSKLGPVEGLTRVGPGDYWAVSYNEDQDAAPSSRSVILHFTGGVWYSSTTP